jgi:peptide-methionine (S)-S-oxide reductase
MSLKPVLLATAAAALLALPFITRASAGDLDAQIPVPAADPANSGETETAVLAGGCFWGQQGVFEHVKGVTKVVAGYSGGARETAHYEDVSEETTGHAESVQVTFDPRVISFGQILRIYFSVAHDPTQLNRQGPGTAGNRQGLYRPAGPGPCLCRPHRDQSGAAQGLLCGRGLSPGLSVPSPA